mgnify:CR=1 FL=1
MTTRRERAKSQKPQIRSAQGDASLAKNKQLEAEDTEQKPQQGVNQRREKLADFLIDVAKYVFTGVIITSLFNDMADKATLYIAGMAIVFISLTLGILLTNKRKNK